MKISIITVVYNREATIERAINSVLAQNYPGVEYIIIDGGSTDQTVEIVSKYKSRLSQFISEKDKGIYDALNKGIKLATGDVVGMLHSDDVFSSPEIVAKIATTFTDNPLVDCVYGDVAFVNVDNPQRIIRYYSSARFNPDKFERGFMPAHPSFFCRKNCFDRMGNYSLHYPIAADFDLLVRFLKIHGARSKYIPVCTTHMSLGGTSTSGWKATVNINKQLYQILKSHEIPTNYWMLYSRYFVKGLEYF